MRERERERERTRIEQNEKVGNTDIDGELDRETGDPKRPGAPVLVMGG